MCPRVPCLLREYHHRCVRVHGDGLDFDGELHLRHHRFDPRGELSLKLNICQLKMKRGAELGPLMSSGHVELTRPHITASSQVRERPRGTIKTSQSLTAKSRWTTGHAHAGNIYTSEIF